MTIIIDADGCPVRKEAVQLAKKYKLKATIVSDVNHMIKDNYADIVTVDKGYDAVDFKIIGLMNPGDLVVTQDYGLASLVLSKKGYAIDQNGMFYNSDNIDMLLLRRHVSKQVRKAGGKTKGPSKRKKEDTDNFIQALEKFLTKTTPK